MGFVKEGQCSKKKGPGKGAESSGFVLLTARHPGPSSVSRVRSLSGPRVRQLAPSAAPVPSTLPSWTHEDTSVHARGRDRSPEERRTRHITAAVMRLHSLQVCASSHAARPGCYSAPPLSHTHSRREPGEGRRLRDGEMLIMLINSSQYIYIFCLYNFLKIVFKYCFVLVNQVSVFCLISWAKCILTHCLWACYSS